MEAPTQTQACCDLRWQIDDAFERGWNDLARMLSATGEAQSFSPVVDLTETDAELVVRAELPGVARELLEVEVLPRRVTLRGRRHGPEGLQQGTYHRMESSGGAFERTLVLPAEVDPAGAQGELRRGILRLTLPKRDARAA